MRTRLARPSPVNTLRRLSRPVKRESNVLLHNVGNCGYVIRQPTEVIDYSGRYKTKKKGPRSKLRFGRGAASYVSDWLACQNVTREVTE